MYNANAHTAALSSHRGVPASRSLPFYRRHTLSATPSANVGAIVYIGNASARGSSGASRAKVHAAAAALCVCMCVYALDGGIFILHCQRKRIMCVCVCVGRVRACSRAFYAIWST